MLRQEVLLGVCRIENDKKRNDTFTKRHANFFKSASNLSALTGVRVAVILEKESGKMHGFGMPLVEPIVDSFLSGDPLIEPLVDEQAKDRIVLLQREVTRLDMENAKLDTRANLSLQHIKKIQAQNPRLPANNIFSKGEDLSLEDLTNLFNALLRVKEVIRRRLPPLQHGHEPTTGGPNVRQNWLLPSGPSQDHPQIHQTSQKPSSSHNLPPQVMPPVLVPLTPQRTMEPHFPMHLPHMFYSPVYLRPTISC
ncbi:hypothetical protein CFC21_019685 [Triticum aestivum]|uniref:MADS-box domain-containing protein n=3 Tax=Triticum TaxID=4564 RepID=A0A9R1P797_TRITD|nr:hypothetical protein CFC21_019685 [Triticum aestivum]VAH38144.1 unnamed protein product [Triticum turgidum subsp. durum]